MCVCVHVCVRARILCGRMYVFVCVYVYVIVGVCMCVWKCVCKCVCVFKSVCVCLCVLRNKIRNHTGPPPKAHT